MHMDHRVAAALVLALLLAVSLGAQTTSVAPAGRDKPSIALGTLIFGDYTYVQSPAAKDANGNTIHPSSFNLTRSYINFTGNLNHLIGFRVTPDIVRQSGSGGALDGSLAFRLKYAFAQVNLDDWAPKGTWLRFGLQQTPWIDYAEGLYRYRFQGPTFVDREGLFPSSDGGFSGHYNFAGNYGDIHAGIYNGEGFAKAETNNEKAFQLRGTIRPLPRSGALKGLRVSGFYDADHYSQSANRTRVLGQVSFEHPWVNAAAEYVTTTDRTSAGAPSIDGRGYSLWATPRFGATGWELLFRHDQFEPDTRSGSLKHERNIAGVAYWFRHMSGVTSAVMLDYDSMKQHGLTPARPDDTRYGIKMLVSY